MKHKEKEWYTCDRCGRRIEKVPSNTIFHPFTRRIIKRMTEFEIKTVSKDGYLSKSELLLPDVVSMEICEYYEGKINTIHLCGKCRKEFERFMRSGKNI